MPRPNIVFLMTDHTNSQALASGSQCLTPNLDALAAEGTRFGRCYTTNAICSPARASLMTGTYPSTHGVWDCTHTQRREWVDVREGLSFWSQRLKDTGYVTGYFGKWHVEQSNDLAGFGWDESDHRIGSARARPQPGTEVVVPKEGYKDYLLAASGVDEGDDPHHPAFSMGIDFIRRHAEEANPFCCFISASEPHDAYVPPKRFLDMYDIGNVELSRTLHASLDGKPDVLKRMRAVWAGLSDEQWRFVTAAYWAVITFIDSEVGRVVSALKEAGAYDDTIIVFTSDHGDMLGGHGLVTKGIGTPYEEVYNVPLIVRVPGMTGQGDDNETVTSLVDLGPTLAELAGAEAMEPCQGRSLLPVLKGTDDPADWRGAYAEFFGQRFVYTQRMVWHGDWKYVFSPGGLDELYNLAEDPHEQTNRAGDQTCRGTLVDMVRRMWMKMEEIGDESLLNTHYATLRTAPVGPGVIHRR